MFDQSKKITDVHRTFFGINALYSFDTDDIRESGTKLLKAMKCGSFRFPGGEISDEYLWKEKGKYMSGGKEGKSCSGWRQHT